MSLSTRPVRRLGSFCRIPGRPIACLGVVSSSHRLVSTSSSPAIPQTPRPRPAAAAHCLRTRTSSSSRHLNSTTLQPPAARTMATNAASQVVPASAGQRLAGKTILITGASAGIGQACALEFALAQPHDLRLILAARRLDVIKEIATAITKQVGDGVKILPLQLDVSKPDEVRTFVGKLPEEFKNIDILINNAGGVRGVETAGNIAESDINIMFDTNVTGLINVTQAVLPIFFARPDGGAGDIVNIGSIAGREPYAGGSIYCATKAAVRSFTDSLRRETISTKIRVMEVDPGAVETVRNPPSTIATTNGESEKEELLANSVGMKEFSVVRFRGDKAKAAATYAGMEPLTPQDIAEVIVFNVTRRQNVVVADSLIFPTVQAGTGAANMYRKPA
ncbi:Short-chain dehydrogenase/reductase SDR [Akanthomyces lecanii RCEF 1005]|uniref:Short-chain dehydrogenase/reductase SDR n=1 Tax=Akanthomyces lecanii RCEF 1005 TaxID=1081108 RepID=A0A168C291_CORDF|nr:Short-chain dehydrogenase/reductase SDR [Akanthomyces lecanii RCEF 1005]